MLQTDMGVLDVRAGESEVLVQDGVGESYWPSGSLLYQAILSFMSISTQQLATG